MLVADRIVDEAERMLEPRLIRMQKNKRLAAYTTTADEARKALAREERFLAELLTIPCTEETP